VVRTDDDFGPSVRTSFHVLCCFPLPCGWSRLFLGFMVKSSAVHRVWLVYAYNPTAHISSAAWPAQAGRVAGVSRLNWRLGGNRPDDFTEPVLGLN
jgi:hypothetical protein